jgi:hypothetical protein
MCGPLDKLEDVQSSQLDTTLIEQELDDNCG